jgi:NAD-dependent deacetylase
MFSEKFLSRLKNAYSVVALSGSRISEESAIPLIKGKNELWKNYKVEEIASIDTYHKNAKLFWDFYKSQIQSLENIEPNLGHYALVDMERIFKDFILITQNIDDLHRKAGNKKIIELYGNIYKLKCSNCGESISIEAKNLNQLFQCKKCSGNLRPAIILFGENVESRLIAKAQEVSSGSDVFIAVGTSGLYEPSVSLAYLAKANGSFLIEINSEETSLTQHVDEYLYGNPSKLLPQLVMLIEKIK